MMMATCKPGLLSEVSQEVCKLLCFIKHQLKKILPFSQDLVITRCPDQDLHMIKVVLQGLAPGSGKAIFGPGNASRKILAASNIRGFLQLPRVHAEVPVGGLHQLFEITEAERIIHSEGTHDAEPEALVNQTIESVGACR